MSVNQFVRNFLFVLLIFGGSATAQYSIVPKPWKVIPSKGVCSPETGWQWRFAGTDSLETFQRYYQSVQAWADSVCPDYFKPLSAFDYGTGQVVFQLISKPELGNEGYEINLKTSEIEVSAQTCLGLFYSLQSLKQLLHGYQSRQVTIPCGRILDKPRFTWRGMHLDVSRHFFSVKEIETYLEMLALHKMNVFHWHLTDDQGWRLEIKSFPRLTEIGAWRKETMIGHYYDSPRKFDGIPHGGFYTQAEVRHLVQYAAERGITIVPEIEIPGHCQEMVAAYPELGSFSDGKIPEVMCTWGGTQHILNPFPPTLRFLETVLDEVITLFPSTYIHIGGDEAIKTHWRQNPKIQKFKDSLGLQTERQLQSWMVRHFERYLSGKGRKLMGWDEILEGGLAPNAAVMSWRGEKGGIAAARMKHVVVMSPGTHCYFDKYQMENKKEEPVAIGGFIPLSKVYSYEPQPLVLNPTEKKFILGAQGNVWTEYIPTFSQVQYMAMPRMAALAEVVWSPASGKDFVGFKKRMPGLTALYKANRWNWCSKEFQTP
jgi:hexosaminidase